MNNAGKSNDERIVAYAVQNGQTPSFTIAGMKLAFTVKFPANRESEVWLLSNSEIEIIFNTQGQYSLLSATFSSDVKGKKNPLSL